MTTRQSKSIAKIRSDRRARGQCRDCGRKCNTFRCANCNERRRDYMRLLMQRKRKSNQ